MKNIFPKTAISAVAIAAGLAILVFVVSSSQIMTQAYAVKEETPTPYCVTARFGGGGFITNCYFTSTAKEDCKSTREYYKGIDEIESVSHCEKR